MLVVGTSASPNAITVACMYDMTLPLSHHDPGRDAEDARIVAVYSTKSAIVLTTSTTTTPFTCAFATNNVVCQRRRYKRFHHMAGLETLREYVSTLITMIYIYHFFNRLIECVL